MAEQPTVGGSDGSWGTTLNTYLSVGHSAAGVPNYAGLTAQVVNTQVATYSALATGFPIDNTIPQITEGTEVMTLAITPKSVTNKLKITVVCNLSADGTSSLGVGLFQDATAGALNAAYGYSAGPADGSPVTFTHYMTSGTTSATTFRVRAGNAAGSANFNGGAARMFGGIMYSSITIEEIWV